MMIDIINIKLDDEATKPTRAHKTDAGFDLYSTEDFDLKPGERVVIDTGVHFAIPDGYYGEVANRSGLNFNYGITLHGSGTIDSSYRGNDGFGSTGK